MMTISSIFKTPLKKNILIFAFFCSFFPFISFRLNSMDLQPYSFLIAIFCISLFFLREIPRESLPLLIVGVLANFISFISATSVEQAIRSSIIYWSPFIFFVIAMKCREYNVNVNKIVKSIFCIYLFVAILQLVFGKLIFDFLLVNRTSDNRGVNSLATEPSVYGFLVFLLLIFLVILKKDFKTNYFFVFLAIIQVLFFAKSATSILVLVSAFAVYFAFEKFYLFVLFVLSIAFSIYLMVFFQSEENQSRVVAICIKLIEAPENILYADGSVSERFYHIFLSVKSFIIDFFMPHGISNFHNTINTAHLEYPSFYWDTSYDAPDKVMSGWGGALYELGFIGLIYLYILFKYTFFNTYELSIKMFIFFGYIFVFMCSATFAIPSAGLILGFLAFEKRIKQNLTVIPN